MSNLDLAYTPAVELARLIRERALSPVDVVENSLRRIDEVNPSLNCFCAVYPEEALARARDAERAVMASEPLGPLHGVPVAIKDFTPTKGKRTTRGSLAFEDWVPEDDAIVVERLLCAGAIMIGKTTTPEFAASRFTRSPLLGTTRNPWNPERTSGGSSGGSAVAVASGCVPLAEGSDMGGSIRSPASYCGLVGLKPSFGRIPFEILPSVFDQTCHFGPLARTIDDAALFLDVTKGPDDRDIQSFIPPLRIPIPVPADVRGMRLAFSPDLGYATVDPEVDANARAALERLQGLGAEVDEVDPAIPVDAVLAGSLNWAAYTAAMWEGLLPRWRDKMTPSVLRRIDNGLAAGGVELKRTEFARTQLWQRLRPIFQRYDALLCPTTITPVPSADPTEGDVDTIDEHGRYHGVELTFPFNLVGPCPAISVPSGFFADGLPTGLQIVGRVHDEVTVLTIGAALEAALEWRAHRPPI